MARKNNLGALGERLAERFLIAKGYRIIFRNWRCRLGEIDLIAEHDGLVIFVEVKLRTQNFYGRPEDSLNFFKMRRFLSAVKIYLNENSWIKRYRLDAILVQFCSEKRLAQIEHLLDLAV